jgi:PAS domain S-box-containing protein
MCFNLGSFSRQTDTLLREASCVWKEMLLQLLIALLPVFLFLVWFDRPDRTRRVSLFLAVFCGMAMLLDMRLSVVLEQGIHFDLRHIPLIIGSLYGGVTVAVFLSVLYAGARLFEVLSPSKMMLLAFFMIIFIPPLIRLSLKFPQYGRIRRYKMALVLFALVFGIYIAVTIMVGYGSAPVEFWKQAGVRLAYWAVFLFGIVTSVYFLELAFERVRLQRELQDMSHKYRGEMQRLQQFIDQAPLVVIIFDAEGYVTHVNEETLQLLSPLGVSSKDLLYRHFEDIIRIGGIDHHSPIDRNLRGEERVVEMIDFGGKTFYTVTCTIKDQGSQVPDGILFIGHDVTELQQLKDEVGRMERLSLVGQMAASITHEIRNPMAVIRGFVQLLNERSPSEQQSYFHIVLDELDRANGIINDFLSLAQNRIVEKEISSLHEVMNDLTPLLRADANMRGQMVETDLSQETEPLAINSKEIKQLVLNLARNGMEAMKDKGILRIETVNLENTVQLRVVDHGVGIPQEKLEHLFDPFYTTKANGTGLGLSLCLSIVERHNARIEVESVVGAGTTFIVTFCKPGRQCW